MEPKSAAEATHNLLTGYDPDRTEVMATDLRRLWLRAAPTAEPELAGRPRQMLRDWGIKDPHFEAFGTPVPVLAAIGREIGKAARRRVAAFLPLTSRLWAEHGREGRIVAVVAMGPMELADPQRVVPVLKDLARTCIFWEDCDQLAMKALEPVLRRDPAQWLEPLGEWVLDGNKWVCRAGLVAIGRLPMERPDYTARCVELEAAALGNPDLDVKRALSFALRLNARGQVAPVREFVLAHQDQVDPDAMWVLCDLIRSMTRELLPQFAGLLPIYRAWLETAPPKARRSVEGAIRLLEAAQ